MNIYYFDKIVYKGNINRDFYFFCCKRNIRMYLYILIHLIYSFLSLFSYKFELLKNKKYHQYLKNIKNIDALAKEFYKEKKNKINPWYLKRSSKKNIIISNSPEIIVKHFTTSENLIAYDLNDKFELDIESYHKNIEKLNEVYEKVFYNKFSDVKKFSCDEGYVYKKSIIFKESFSKYYALFKFALKLFLAGLLAYLLLVLSFSFTTVYLDKTMIESYFLDKELLRLNFIPIFILILFFLALTKRLWVSFGISSFFVFAIGITNKTKLAYRDDVFKFEDLTLIREATNMLSRYKILIRWYNIVAILGCIIIMIWLRKNVKKINIKLRYRGILLILIAVISVHLYKNVYTNEQIYNSVGDTSIIDPWITVRQSQIRGLIYPFIYSATEITYTEPEDYDAKEAKKILEAYTYDNIDEDKKVNVISIMLESYNDFSKFGVVDFITDPYIDFHNIQKKSISGSTIVRVFGGGTSNSERRFLTSFYSLPSFRKQTNSYVRYFKEQGYVTEAMHPYYGAFYNRNTVNYNLGYDNYWNWENKFSNISYEITRDGQLFDTVIENLIKVNKEGKPYFNYTLTYQNHGPYETTEVENVYIKNKGYSENAFNMFNRYLDGIKDTNEALKKLVDFLENYNEPTVLVVFGDHNPYLGENNYTYNELGIDMSLSNPESFINYYSTPYIIYGNNEAKKVLNNDFVGKGETISVDFLMGELFKYSGWSGNEFLKYLNNVNENINVIHDIYNKEDGDYVLRSESKYNNLIEEYKKISYYYSSKEVNK